jgi:hypothetical protein
MTSVERRPSLVLTFTRDVTFVQPGYPISSTPKTLSRQKIPMARSGIEPASFRLIAQYINQLRHRVPQLEVGGQLYFSAALLLIPFGKDAVCAPDTFLTSWRREKSSTYGGIRTPYRPPRSLVTIPTTLSRMLANPYVWKMYTADPHLWRVCS